MFRLKQMRQIFLALTVCFSLSMSAGAVPVIKNESIIYGRVEEYSPVSSRLLGIQPEMVLYKIVVLVSAVETTKGPAYLQEKEGQTIEIYAKEKQTSDLLFKKVKARVIYRGDKRGRLLWLKHIEIVE